MISLDTIRKGGTLDLVFINISFRGKSMTDEQLMERWCMEDCQDSFRQLHDRYERVVKYWASQSTNEADDAAQDTWIRVITHRERFDPTRPFRPWLQMLTKQSAIDRLRKRKETSLSFDPIDERSTLDTDAIRLYVQQLEGPERDVIVGMFFQGRTLHQLSDELHVTVGFVRKMKRQALRSLSRICRH
jgi:RNA polymerase sigma-70 factor, ECF subfamily